MVSAFPHDSTESSEKKALLIGIQYKGSSDTSVPELGDVIKRNLDRLKLHLISRQGYREENIRIMHDDERDDMKPTKDNIVRLTTCIF